MFVTASKRKAQLFALYHRLPLIRLHTWTKACKKSHGRQNLPKEQQRKLSELRLIDSHHSTRVHALWNSEFTWFRETRVHTHTHTTQLRLSRITQEQSRHAAWVDTSAQRQCKESKTFPLKEKINAESWRPHLLDVNSESTQHSMSSWGNVVKKGRTPWIYFQQLWLIYYYVSVV